MNKMAKVLVTIVVVIVFLLLFSGLGNYGLAAGMSTQAVGVFALMLIAALIGILRSIWKKDKSGNGNSNSSVLQK